MHAPRLNRRRLLAGLGSGAVMTVAAPSIGLAATDAADPAIALQTLALDRIQGNVVAGFHQHHQAMVFVGIPDAAAGRAWLQGLVPSVISSADVEAVRERFRAGETVPDQTWVNVALSHSGLKALGRPAGELDSFPRAFRAGMRARARRVGDTGTSDPDTWPTPYRARFDAIIIVAADAPDDLQAEVARQQQRVADAGLSVVYVQEGATRAGQPGHEHFGFRDGVSQPGLLGFTAAQNPDDPGQGLPGQDLLWPGEFVLGYPRQAGPGGGDEPGNIARSGPDWTEDGSYLVFRRLTQDVPGFDGFISEVATTQGISEDLAGAKIVGRYASGAPLTVTGEQAVDPGLGDPSILEPERSNHFEFEDDFDGALVPLAAHIRKTYPRDQPTDDGGEEDTQTHRLLRRGIPFGESFVAGSVDTPTFPDDRGLLFLAYQTSIERQFEHVQRRWVNDPDFPEDDAGQDPVIAQSPATGDFALPGGRPDHVALMQRFVTTSGGEYFIQPSIPALEMLTEPADAAATSGDGDTDISGEGNDGGRNGRTTPARAEASTDENPRKVIAAFFLAMALYAGMAFGTIGYELANLGSGDGVVAATAAVDVAAAITDSDPGVL